MSNTPLEVEDQDLSRRIDKFIARFKIGTLLNRVGIRKMRGVSPLLLLRAVFELSFLGTNIFTGIHNRPNASLRKDSV